MRYLLTILLSLGLVLAACAPADDPDTSPDAGATPDVDATPDATPDVSPELTPDVDATPDATPDVTPDATPDVSPELTPDIGVGACEEAFADVPDLEQLSTFRDIQDALEALDETIRSCDTMDEWTAHAEEHLAALDVDEDEARDFVQHRCDTNDELDDAVLCDEVQGTGFNDDNDDEDNNGS